MFVRFRGEGIGHKATNEFTSAFRPPCESSTDFEMDDNHDSEPEEEKESEAEDEVTAEDLEWGYKTSDGEDDNDDWEDDDLGGEDGEEPWDMDGVDAEGYAEL